MVFIKKKKKNDREKKEGATDFAVGLQGLARSQDKLEGVNRSSSIFFPHHIGSFWNALGWVVQGWVKPFCQFPEHTGPFFLCQSEPDVPRLVLKILILRSILPFCPNWATGAAAHTHQVWLRTDRNTIVFMHTNMAGLRQFNHRGPKGMPWWVPITYFSCTEALASFAHSPRTCSLRRFKLTWKWDLRGGHGGLFSQSHIDLSVQCQQLSITDELYPCTRVFFSRYCLSPWKYTQTNMLQCWGNNVPVGVF